MTQEKGVIVTNDRQNLVSANLGITVHKWGLTMRKMALTMCVRWVTMRALFFIAKNAHMVTNNVRTNLVRIWSLTYIQCLRTFWCNGWSCGCILTSSTTWRWAELAESEYQLNTNHTTMILLRPGTTSEWLRLPSYICYRLNAHKIFSRIVSDHMRIFSNKKQCAYCYSPYAHC